MSGPEHFELAEGFLRDAESVAAGTVQENYYLGAAQVHATLALAASAPLADIVGILTAIRDEIAQLPSSARPA